MIDCMLPKDNSITRLFKTYFFLKYVNKYSLEIKDLCSSSSNFKNLPNFEAGRVTTYIKHKSIISEECL